MKSRQQEAPLALCQVCWAKAEKPLLLAGHVWSRAHGTRAQGMVEPIRNTNGCPLFKALEQLPEKDLLGCWGNSLGTLQRQLLLRKPRSHPSWAQGLRWFCPDMFRPEGLEDGVKQCPPDGPTVQVIWFSEDSELPVR